MSILLHATNNQAHWIHRDIKMDNIFIKIVDASNTSDIKIQFVLGDWKFSGSINEIVTNPTMDVLAGTPFMISPELVQLESFRKYCQRNTPTNLTDIVSNFNTTLSTIRTSIDAYNLVCFYVLF